MGKKDKPNAGNRVVFSTNPDYQLPDDEHEQQETLPPQMQLLYVSLERMKGGKVATLIEGFKGAGPDLEELGKKIKTKCGGGGTVKDGYILVQGDHRDKTIAYLNELGYKTRRKGG